MGRVQSQSGSDSKSHLVTEICDISNRAVSCTHSHHHNTIKARPFVDWYLLLQVEENVGIDIIRKKYHKLALQLHPDKNKHPKAEFAFKLVSEAYSCLADDARREAFNRERWNSFCGECSKTLQKPHNPPTNSYTKLKDFFSNWERPKSNKIVRRAKDGKARFMEEARVIEDCLKTNATTRKDSEREFPIFNPSNYLSQGYPHLRTRRCKKPENLWWLQTENIQNAQQGKGKCGDSPIFECKSKRAGASFKLKSACLSSL